MHTPAERAGVKRLQFTGEILLTPWQVKRTDSCCFSQGLRTAERSCVCACVSEQEKVIQNTQAQEKHLFKIDAYPKDI